MAKVEAMTLEDVDRDLPPRRVVGDLTVHRVEALDYDQYLVDGQHVDPETISEPHADAR